MPSLPGKVFPTHIFCHFNLLKRMMWITTIAQVSEINDLIVYPLPLPPSLIYLNVKCLYKSCVRILLHIPNDNCVFAESKWRLH